MKLARTHVIKSVVSLVVVGLATYGVYHFWPQLTDPYYGLQKTFTVQMTDDQRATIEQRMALTKASIEATEATGGEVDLDLYISYASDSLFLGDLVTAREYTELALKGNSLNPATWDTYGSILERMGDYAKAKEAYTTAITNDSAEEYYRDLVELIENHYPDQVDSIEALLLAAVDDLGQTPWLMVKLGEWYEAHGDCTRAKAHLKVAKTLSPDNQAIADEYTRIATTCKE